jgi:hypothetical protein
LEDRLSRKKPPSLLLGAVLIAACSAAARSDPPAAIAASAAAGRARTTGREDLRFPPETSLVKSWQPPMPEPPLGGSAPFPDLTTTVTRVADGRHHYAKDTPWNSDESYALTLKGDLLDGRTYRPLKRVAVPAEHRTWANSDPDLIYGVTGNRWVRVSVARGETATLATFPEFRTLSYGLGEGNTDNADRWAVLVGNGDTPFLIEARTGARRCTIETKGTVSDATMSQDGRYVLVNWRKQGIDAYDTACALHRHLSDANSHYDACVSTAGEQVIVQVPDSRLLMTRISDGAVTTVLTDSALRIHVSCRNVRRPGWAYVSPYGDQADSVTTGQRVWQRGLAVKLDGSQTVQIYAWLHMAFPTHYDDDPMMVPSPRGDRVWWKVNWDGTSTGIHSFVAERR